MVTAVLLIDTLNSAVSAYTAYDYTVTDFGMSIFCSSKCDTFHHFVGRVDKILRASHGKHTLAFVMMQMLTSTLNSFRDK
jgi:hypothetical protein